MWAALPSFGSHASAGFVVSADGSEASGKRWSEDFAGLKDLAGFRHRRPTTSWCQPATVGPTRSRLMRRRQRCSRSIAAR